MVVSLFLEFFPLLYPSLFLLSCSGFYRFQVKEIQFKIVKLKRVVTGRILGPLTESVEGAVPRHGSEVRDLVPQHSSLLHLSLSLTFASLFAVLTSFLPLMASLENGAAPGLPYPHFNEFSEGKASFSPPQYI